jgi:AcrR family transcriptional regulator
MVRGARKRGDGRHALIEAALREFEDHGYDGTHSNAIAKRAGYAPQTFYRHFADKLEIFIAAYEAWSDAGIERFAAGGDLESYARLLIGHHRAHRVFRRSLRTLTVSDSRVLAARTKARKTQMLAVAGRMPGFAAKSRAGRLAALLTIERLCDAIADEEFAAAGISRRAATGELVTLLRSLS